MDINELTIIGLMGAGTVLILAALLIAHMVHTGMRASDMRTITRHAYNLLHLDGVPESVVVAELVAIHGYSRESARTIVAATYNTIGA